MTDSQQYKYSICRTIGTIGVCVIISLPIILGGGRGFLNIPAALLTFCLTFFLLLGSFGTDFLKFIPASFACLVATPQQPNLKFVEIATFGSRYVLGGSLIFALIINIQMLMNLEDPSTIGVAMATALIAPLYAILASELFFASVRKAFSESRSTGASPLSARNIVLPVIIIGYMMARFFVMIIALTAIET